MFFILLSDILPAKSPRISVVSLSAGCLLPGIEKTVPWIRAPVPPSVLQSLSDYCFFASWLLVNSLQPYWTMYSPRYAFSAAGFPLSQS